MLQEMLLLHPSRVLLEAEAAEDGDASGLP